MSQEPETIIKAEIENLSGQTLSDNSINFFDAKILDSLNIINLVVFVENTFYVKVDPLDVNLQNFGSVKQIATYVRDLKSNA